ncbi:MAG: SDR family oxidoreductase [Polyangiaceae bacterium]|nr:SDR family oxidoreductase [Polyangiaceae bacterium]
MASPIDGGTVVVTGASSGIGRDIAREIAPRAKRIVLVARRKERLEALARELKEANGKLEVDVYAVDLADRTAVKAFAEQAAREVGEVDVLVNNAGLGDIGMFDKSSLEKQLFMIDLNIVGLVALTHAFLPGMIARKRGAILMVSSGFGFSFLPGFAGYIGTKHFVTGFTESLRLEAAGTGVRIGQVCPGPVATEFEENIGNFTGMKAPGFLELSSAACAKACVRAIDWNRALVVPHLLIAFLLLFARYSPRWLVRIVLWPAGRRMRRMQEASSAG